MRFMTIAFVASAAFIQGCKKEGMTGSLAAGNNQGVAAVTVNQDPKSAMTARTSAIEKQLKWEMTVVLERGQRSIDHSMDSLRKEIIQAFNDVTGSAFQSMAAEFPALEVEVIEAGFRFLEILEEAVQAGAVDRLNGLTGWKGPAMDKLREQFTEKGLADEFEAYIKKIGTPYATAFRGVIGEAIKSLRDAINADFDRSLAELKAKYPQDTEKLDQMFRTEKEAFAVGLVRNMRKSFRSHGVTEPFFETF